MWWSIVSHIQRCYASQDSRLSNALYLSHHCHSGTQGNQPFVEMAYYLQFGSNAYFWAKPRLNISGRPMHLSFRYSSRYIGFWLWLWFPVPAFSRTMMVLCPFYLWELVLVHPNYGRSILRNFHLFVTVFHFVSYHHPCSRSGCIRLVEIRHTNYGSSISSNFQLSATVFHFVSNRQTGVHSGCLRRHKRV